MGYRYYNANAMQNNVADCAVRAISLAEGETWDYTYEKLSTLAQRRGEMIDSADFIEAYLDDLYPRERHYAKTVKEFSKEFPHGIFLVTMAGHITCIINGNIYDTFDPSERRMWCAWRIA